MKLKTSQKMEPFLWPFWDSSLFNMADADRALFPSFLSEGTSCTKKFLKLTLGRRICLSYNKRQKTENRFQRVYLEYQSCTKFKFLEVLGGCIVN